MADIVITPPIGTVLTSWDRRRNSYRFVRFGDLGYEIQDRITARSSVYCKPRNNDIVRFSLEGKYLGWNDADEYIRQGFRVAEIRILV